MSITKAIPANPYNVGDIYDPNPPSYWDLPEETKLTTYDDTATLNFGTIANSGNANRTMSVSGALVGDAVSVGLDGTIPIGIIVGGTVTATDTVNVTILNLSGSSFDASSLDVRAVVWGPA
jgi:hypothetical protein